MKLPRLDGDVDDVARAHVRARPEAVDHGRRLHALLGRHLDGSFLTDVTGKLPDVLGESRRRVDREVGDDLGAQRLAEHDDAAQALLHRDLRFERRVLEILRTGPRRRRVDRRTTREPVVQ